MANSYGLNVGDTIEIISMCDEPQYDGRKGVIEHISIDPWGDCAVYGTWGGCAVYPKVDRVRKLDTE